MKSQIKRGKSEILTISEFIELFSNITLRLAKTRSIVEKDFIIRKIYLNFTIKDKKVLSYKLNKPFYMFFKGAKSRFVLNTRDSGTRTHDLLLPKQAF